MQTTNRPTGMFAFTIVWLVPAGPGAGLLIFFCSFGGILVGQAGYFIRLIYPVEALLPEHDALTTESP